MSLEYRFHNQFQSSSSTVGYICPACGSCTPFGFTHICGNYTIPQTQWTNTSGWIPTNEEILDKRIASIEDTLKTLTELIDNLYEEVCGREQEGCEDSATDSQGSGGISPRKPVRRFF